MAVRLEEMQREDVESVISIISRAMDENEGKAADDTIKFHFFCQDQEIDDGRAYYVARVDGENAGICGLYHPSSDLPHIVWLGWFAVNPDFQRQGIGKQMIGKVLEEASQKGFTKMFIETYSSDTFARARRFYERAGFENVGGVRDYLAESVDMVVYGKDL